MAGHVFLLSYAKTEPSRTELTISHLSPRYINCYILLNNVQFTDAELGLPFGHPEEYTDRHLYECGTGRTLTLRTAPSAHFIHVRLPEKNGRIPGVLRYFNGIYSLQWFNDLHRFDNPRC